MWWRWLILYMGGWMNSWVDGENETDDECKSEWDIKPRTSIDVLCVVTNTRNIIRRGICASWTCLTWIYLHYRYMCICVFLGLVASFTIVGTKQCRLYSPCGVGSVLVQINATRPASDVWNIMIKIKAKSIFTIFQYAYEPFAKRSLW